MKIVEESQGPDKKKSLFRKFFVGLYHILVLHIYVVLAILGAGISIAILLFFAELLIPKAVHFYNYSMSDGVFTALVNDHKYHAAVSLMEIKNDMIDSSKHPYRFRQELADCYIPTGDYPKALEQYRLLRKWYDKEIRNHPPKDMTPAQLKQFKDFINICFLREEFRIYLKMGDIANVRKYYGKMKTIHETTDWNKLGSVIGDEEELNELLDGRKLEDGFRLELIQGRYLTDPAGAIAEMEEFIADIFDSPKYSPSYKLMLINEQIGMLLKQDRLIGARKYLEPALEIVDSYEYNQEIYRQLGPLSDYCYQLNDIDNGGRLLKKYLSLIDDTYDRSDIDYAVAHSKEFKYLESDKKWDKLTDQVIDASAALRGQIARNFTGMTSAQREYFIEQFKPLFSYANRLMEMHPSDKLAMACFENNMFLRGLLLRSETSVANAITAMGNQELSGKYNRYVEASQELVARQYISGPGNYYAKKQLESEIASLEEEIAAASRDFRRENETAALSIDRLRKSLDKDDVALIIAEGDKTVFALLTDRSGKVTYKPLVTKERLKRLTQRAGEIYVDPDAVIELFGSIIPMISGKDVYLTTTGLFNQISVGALPADDRGAVLGDLATFHVVGSPTDIPQVKSACAEKLNLASKNIVLWGGVDYGSDGREDNTAVSQTRGLMRGDILGRLHGSREEVYTIAGLLNDAGANPTIIAGLAATEQSFTSRSRKHDYILHVSTHGFFHDSGSFTNPMQNSGLLFANSQKYWANDCLVSSINEDDGILRADEIARLDLNGCRLVVLSACQTGLGEYNSEGVYGLQRAFKLAGAQSILMSLWSVDDKATAELMVEFYKGLIAGHTPDYSLTAAQRTLRAQGYPPAKWAAFVLLN